MGHRILIVEDEPNIVDALSFLLARDGHAISTEIDGLKAAGRIDEVTPDLIVLDAMLPGRSGFDILRDLRGGGNDVPVLMLTAKGQSKDRDAALEAGASRFMVKPFSNSDVLEVVNELLSGA